ncbi:MULTISPECIES: disulfide oxidoreductase [Bacillaceae]|jgi:disulfide bond formation protein DsbB|uniref:Probable disulfide formation protein n=1 Tax=Rossellomorea vietnamensis TaxID=218284 RepID=A0A6I6USJ7_9BACI|nr:MULTISPECIES: disulfide oxidoreductase [Rossellomorea]MBH9965650.1 disulfide bond formation protein B [[Bacillus] enclensis]MBW3111152.1 disulfide bond formation protein B [Bacillus sp. MCCB 382]MDX8345176.1 disulfide oxidoreductase [Rossellomorea sp. YZS02]QHE62909.1 disulfide bond formation protein B [Rossellomorea vietnamensis]
MKEVSRSQYFLYGAWVVSIIATLGSLYFSEIRGFIPCELCWFQRIFMYPLTLILGVATFQNDSGLRKIILPMSIVGGTISILHYLEQKVEGFGGIKPCASGVPCNAEYINWLGFITIPFLALTAFVFITIFTLLSANKR